VPFVGLLYNARCKNIKNTYLPAPY